MHAEIGEREETSLQPRRPGRLRRRLRVVVAERLHVGRRRRVVPAERLRVAGRGRVAGRRRIGRRRLRRRIGRAADRRARVPCRDEVGRRLGPGGGGRAGRGWRRWWWWRGRAARRRGRSPALDHTAVAHADLPVRTGRRADRGHRHVRIVGVGVGARRARRACNDDDRRPQQQPEPTSLFWHRHLPGMRTTGHGIAGYDCRSVSLRAPIAVPVEIRAPQRRVFRLAANVGEDGIRLARGAVVRAGPAGRHPLRAARTPARWRCRRS